MYIGENLRTLRKENGWTQEEIAEAIGISAQSIIAPPTKPCQIFAVVLPPEC